MMAFVSAVGEKKPMPSPAYAVKLIKGKNTFTHDNTGRVLGRLMRDYDAWAHKDVTPQ
jgi:hypothetical protein